MSMARVGMQLMLAPPRAEGHLPPVVSAAALVYAPPGSIYLGSKVRNYLKCPRGYSNKFEEDSTLTNEEACLWYMGDWLALCESEQVKITADLVEKIFICEQPRAERPSHAHFLAAMVAHFTHAGNPQHSRVALGRSGA